MLSNPNFFSIFSSGFDELSNKKLKYIFVKIFFLTSLILGIIIYFIFSFLFQGFEQLLSPENYENAFLLWILKFNFISYFFIIFQFFFTWFFLVIIIIPISAIISGLFAEKILDAISENNKYKIKEKRKKNAFLISFLYSTKSSIKAIIVNILIIPLYFLLPFANIVIFVLINSYFVGREFMGNVLSQYFDEKKINEFYMFNSREVNLIGCFTTILFLIPVVNIAAGFLGLVISSKFFLQSRVKKLR